MLELTSNLYLIIFDSDKDSNTIYYYASIYHSNAFYIFGGTTWNNNLENIARLDEVTQTWSLAGKLKSSRSGHGVIFDGSNFLVIGGYENQKTENCVLEGTVMTCIEQESPALDNYRAYPALFLTDNNYGDNC